MRFDSIRMDYRIIYEIIEPKAKVLDLGCGEGDLMLLLAQGKEAKVQGIEIDEKAIYKCVEKGLSVFHGDIDSGLSEYPDTSFDYVILNQSLQQVRRVDLVIQEALRVGRRIIIGFPNFANLHARIQLFFKGKAPVTPSLPHSWFQTPNLRFLSIIDFLDYCRVNTITVERSIYLTDKRRVRFLPNLFANTGIFVISK
jgi:methionine biosynthesis protein MetW